MVSPTEKLSSPQRRLWSNPWWWLRLAVTSLLVVYLLWRVGPNMGAVSLHLARPLLLLPALGGIVAAMLLSVWQWHLLIPPPARIPFPQLLNHYVWGFFWNNFLPSGLGGDAVRAWGLRNSSGRTQAAVNSVLMARLSALWGVVLLAAGAAPFYVHWVAWETAFRLILITMGLLAATAGGTALLWSPWLSALLQRLLPWLADWHAALQDDGRHWERLLPALLLALATQLWAVLNNILVAQALGLDVHPWQLLLGMPLINLAVSIPLSLGGLGLREGAYLYFLGLVGAKETEAVLLSLSVYVLLVLVAAIGAGICALLGRPPGKSAAPTREGP
ncbi:MAG: flippase-like domain-containing protein [Chloroflexia bacterium]|nr:flippase-like domain-containing protein [Chloroflexia bacterium]